DNTTVTRRTVTVGGVQQNSIIVLEGLEPGDIIASAGVSFLREGQKVKLLDGEG
ncbi:MAG: efflux RND transporter periplasmic adaptor subunit, partial [Litoreibacter sp.]|nr:efflux RND transporter periplasmic adaptor subunit [Litoreibacter sp.]